MDYDRTVKIMRELKGVALHVFILLEVTPVPVNLDFLQRTSGYSDKPVRSSLIYLRERGYAVKGKDGWVIAPGLSRQLVPIPTLIFPGDQQRAGTPAQSAEVGCLPEVESPHTDCGEGRVSGNGAEATLGLEADIELPEVENPDMEAVEGRISGSPINSINTNISINDDINTINKQTRKNPGSGSLDPPEGKGEGDSEERQKVLQAFSDCGIRLNSRTRKLVEVVSAGDVWKAYRDLYNQGRHNETGILIHILEGYAAKGKREESFEGSRYAEWEDG